MNSVFPFLPNICAHGEWLLKTKTIGLLWLNLLSHIWLHLYLAILYTQFLYLYQDSRFALSPLFSITCDFFSFYPDLILYSGALINVWTLPSSTSWDLWYSSTPTGFEGFPSSLLSTIFFLCLDPPTAYSCFHLSLKLTYLLYINFWSSIPVMIIVLEYSFN